jgi:hypothetical protein
MDLSDFRLSPTYLSRGFGWPLPDDHPDGPLVLRWSPLAACHRHYPGKFQGRYGWTIVRRSLDNGLPLATGGSALATYVFGACSTFTHVMARWLAELPKSSPFPSKALAGLLPCQRLRLLPVGTIRYRHGSRTHGIPNTCTTHRSGVSDLRRLPLTPLRSVRGSEKRLKASREV